MKGIVFNLLQEAASRAFGESAWDDILDRAQLGGAYTSLGNYPDAEMVELVAAASEALGKPPDAVLRWFGTSAIPLLAEKYPVFFEGHSSTRSFLLTINDVIHKEVKKVYPGAEAPSFGLDAAVEDRLVMTYASGRKLCSLAEGFIQGAAAHYGDEVTLEHPQCMIRGADCCTLRLAFRKLAG